VDRRMIALVLALLTAAALLVYVALAIPEADE
jgi:hypothetical protein